MIVEDKNGYIITNNYSDKNKKYQNGFCKNPQK